MNGLKGCKLSRTVSSSAKLEMLNITFSLIAALFNKTFCNDGNVPYLCGYSALGM